MLVLEKVPHLGFANSHFRTIISMYIPYIHNFFTFKLINDSARTDSFFFFQRQPTTKQRILDAETNNLTEQCGITLVEDIAYNAIG